MSPASYLTAPPRGCTKEILAALARLALTCESVKSRNHVGDGAGGSWNRRSRSRSSFPILWPVAARRTAVHVPPPLRPGLAVLVALRRRPRPGLPLHRCRRPDRRDQVAHAPRRTASCFALLWLAISFSVTSYFALRTPDDGGGGDGPGTGGPRAAVVARLRTRVPRLHARRPGFPGQAAEYSSRRLVTAPG